MEALKGLFADDPIGGKKPEPKPDPNKKPGSNKCPNCGAIMESKGGILVCAFCGTRKR